MFLYIYDEEYFVWGNSTIADVLEEYERLKNIKR